MLGGYVLEIAFLKLCFFGEFLGNTWFSDIYTGAQPEIFHGRGGFVELWHFDKPFVKNTRKGSAEKKFGAFSPTLKTTFSMEDSTQGWTQLGPFIPKSGLFVRFSKMGRGDLPPSPLVARLIYRWSVLVFRNLLFMWSSVFCLYSNYHVFSWTYTESSILILEATRICYQSFSEISELFYDGGPYHIETSPLICRANQWTGL